MANRSYLVSHHLPPTTPGAHLLRTLNPDTETLAGASYRVPFLWLTLFAPKHFVDYAVEGGNIPVFISPLPESRALLDQRGAIILRHFPEWGRYWSEWERLVHPLENPTLILDFTEILMLDDEASLSEVHAALRWFETGSKKDLVEALEIAGIAFDDRNLTYRLQSGDSLGHCLRGIEWVRPVPWTDD